MKRKLGSKNLLSFEKLTEESHLCEEILKNNFDLSVNNNAQFFERKNSISSKSGISSKSIDSISTKYETRARSDNLLRLDISPEKSIRQTNDINDYFTILNYFKVTAYILSSANQLIKHKIVIIDKDLYVFRYYPQQYYGMERIIHLSGYFPVTCDNLSIENSTFHTIALIPQYGKTLTYRNNLFLFKNENKMKTAITEFNKTLAVQDINNYYNINNQIGKGGYGVVKKGVNKKTFDEVAIKIIEKKKFKSHTEVNLVKNEIDILKYLKYSENCNIIKLYEVFEDKSCIYLVMEYVEGGTLTSYLESRGSERLNEYELKTISLQLANGLHYINKSCIIHRDIKPDNILITTYAQSDYKRDICIKISDFGLSKVIGYNEETKEGYGSLLFTSPEILSKTGYNHKTDSWSFGVTLYYLLFGKYPFDSQDSNLQIIAKMIICNKLEFPIKFEISNAKAVRSLLSGCLNKNPSQRLNFNEIFDFILTKWLV